MRITTCTRWVVVVMAAGAVVVAGCAGSDSGDDTASDAAEEAGAETQAEGGGDAAFGGAAEGDAAARPAMGVDTVALAQDREIVRTGTVQMVVDDAEGAADDIRRLAGEAGGFVADEQVRSRDAEVDVTVRVPADGFDDVRGRIADLGEIVEQDVEARDVTAEVVDVETRIASLRASVERLQGLLGGAGDVAQLASVEGELARREIELEAMLGQQRVLRDQVDLATLTVHLTEDEDPQPDDDAAGFGDGLRRGWVVAIDVGRAGLAVLGFLVPFLLPALVVAVPVRWRVLRRRGSSPPAAPPAPTEAGA